MSLLSGLKVVEFAGIGPAPMAAMMLADQGASVLRLERPSGEKLGVAKPLKFDLLLRGRPRITVDLKRPAAVAFALSLLEKADVLLEGFRPGTMERLGLGPDVCLARNPRLVYGRMTGWGQDGPLAQVAGHDANYIALTGALHAIGRAGEPPTVPLNLVGDFGGGAAFLAYGVMAALFAVNSTGRGQVVDAAMVDGAATLMTPFYGLHAAGLHRPERGTNLLDSGAPFYDVYACGDGEYLAVAPLESKFRAVFLQRLGLGDGPDGSQRSDWPQLRQAIQTQLRTKSRDEWAALFFDTDACVAPVLTMAQAPQHAHNRARGAFIEIDGVVQPAPAPRFSASPAATPTGPAEADATLRPSLHAWGCDDAQVDALIASGALCPQTR